MDNNTVDIDVDENFLKKFLKGFYHKVIQMKNYNNYEKFLSEWIIYKIEINSKSSKKILESMENHEESKFLFTSVIGFFYQLGIGCALDMKKSIELYLLTINIKIKNDSLNENLHILQLIESNNISFKSLRNNNIIIGKILISLFYYKDIILDYNKLTILQELSENGDLGAQYNLAIRYQNGNGIKNDYKKAFKLLLNCAKKGNLNAQYHLAICYMDGIGTHKDKKEAFKWFLKSEYPVNKIKGFFMNMKSELKEFKKILNLAIANNSTAQCYMGFYYQEINKNEKKAFEWYMKSAIGGCAEGQNSLGFCYECGTGTDKNEKKAFEWYMKSAIGGCAEGQNRLGFCYECGTGTDKDETKAFEWYMKSAIAGSAKGQKNLGFCYEYGVGTDKDETKAFEWYTKSASGHNLEYCV
ncbi:hypothetical protein C1645_832053 [Glomus cerebriforme]|uniref:HCP-like protein n=1 Tax=Glomus cerebriforme TaxID=658196 RepID=A0A397SKG1_9GLOM|nr:hypothetical protein C1645_832053 [Glomus cerebriforme]